MKVVGLVENIFEEEYSNLQVLPEQVLQLWLLREQLIDPPVLPRVIWLAYKFLAYSCHCTVDTELIGRKNNAINWNLQRKIDRETLIFSPKRPKLSPWDMVALGPCWQSVWSWVTRKTRAAGFHQKKKEVLSILALHEKKQKWRWKRPFTFMVVVCKEIDVSFCSREQCFHALFKCFIACHTTSCACVSCK